MKMTRASRKILVLKLFFILCGLCAWYKVLMSLVLKAIEINFVHMLNGDFALAIYLAGISYTFVFCGCLIILIQNNGDILIKWYRFLIGTQSIYFDEKRRSNYWPIPDIVSHFSSSHNPRQNRRKTKKFGLKGKSKRRSFPPYIHSKLPTTHSSTQNAGKPAKTNSAENSLKTDVTDRQAEQLLTEDVLSLDTNKELKLESLDSSNISRIKNISRQSSLTLKGVSESKYSKQKQNALSRKVKRTGLSSNGTSSMHLQSSSTNSSINSKSRKSNTDCKVKSNSNSLSPVSAELPLTKSSSHQSKEIKVQPKDKVLSQTAYHSNQDIDNDNISHLNKGFESNVSHGIKQGNHQLPSIELEKHFDVPQTPLFKTKRAKNSLKLKTQNNTESELHSVKNFKCAERTSTTKYQLKSSNRLGTPNQTKIARTSLASNDNEAKLTSRKIDKSKLTVADNIESCDYSETTIVSSSSFEQNKVDSNQPEEKGKVKIENLNHDLQSHIINSNISSDEKEDVTLKKTEKAISHPNQLNKKKLFKKFQNQSPRSFSRGSIPPVKWNSSRLQNLITYKLKANCSKRLGLKTKFSKSESSFKSESNDTIVFLSRDEMMRHLKFETLLKAPNDSLDQSNQTKSSINTTITYAIVFKTKKVNQCLKLKQKKDVPINLSNKLVSPVSDSHNNMEILVSSKAPKPQIEIAQEMINLPNKIESSTCIAPHDTEIFLTETAALNLKSELQDNISDILNLSNQSDTSISIAVNDKLFTDKDETTKSLKAGSQEDSFKLLNTSNSVLEATVAEQSIEVPIADDILNSNNNSSEDLKINVEIIYFKKVFKYYSETILTQLKMNFSIADEMQLHYRKIISRVKEILNFSQTIQSHYNCILQYKDIVSRCFVGLDNIQVCYINSDIERDISNCKNYFLDLRDALLLDNKSIESNRETISNDTKALISKYKSFQSCFQELASRYKSSYIERDQLDHELIWLKKLRQDFDSKWKLIESQIPTYETDKDIESDSQALEEYVQRLNSTKIKNLWQASSS